LTPECVFTREHLWLVGASRRLGMHYCGGSSALCLMERLSPCSRRNKISK